MAAEVVNLERSITITGDSERFIGGGDLINVIVAITHQDFNFFGAIFHRNSAVICGKHCALL